MKKYLLLLLTMLTTTLGAWAEEGTLTNGSSWVYSDNVLTITFSSQSDYTGDIMNALKNTSLSGKTIEKLVIKTASNFTLNTATGGASTQGSDELWGFGKDLTKPVLDLSTASLTSATNGYYPMNGNNNETRFMNVIVPSEYNSNVLEFILTTAYQNTDCGSNKYSVNGTTLTAAINNPTYFNSLTIADLTSSPISTVKVVGSVDAVNLATFAAGKTIDLTGVTGGSGTITVPSDVTVIVDDATVASRISPNTNVKNLVIECTASDLATKVSALDPLKPISITITGGELTNDIMGTFSSAAMSNVTRIDLANATIASGSDIANLTVPASLTQLVLPSATNSTNPAIPNALRMRLAGLSNLDYVYIPTNDAGATTPGYVYVMKTGGLAQAFENESTLRDDIYIKVASTVALSTADVDFSALTNKPTSYQFLDFSSANLTPEMLRNYKTPVADYSPTYRMILPNGWSGDDMANFAAVQTSPSNYRGSNIAAVYSYSGTTLKILGITNSYSPIALKDPRIVRDGTKTVEFVSGTYDSNMYGRFTPTMLAAVNNAGKTSDFKDESGSATSVTSGNESIGTSITSFRILTEKLWSADDNSTAFSALTFENPTITTLNLTGIKNDTYKANQAVINLNGCTSLQGLNLDGVHAASVTANVSTLQTIGMTGIAIEGNLSFQGAAITVFTASGRVAGDIDLTNCNSLGSIDIVNVVFANSSSVSTLQGSSQDGSLTTGDLIVTRNSTTNAEDGVYTGETSGYAKITGNIKTSETFGTGLIDSGDATGRIYPQISAVATPPYSANTAGYKKDGCALSITLDGTTEEADGDLTKSYKTLSAALAYIAAKEGETLTPCNLTINTTSSYSLTEADITAINGLSFSYYDEYGTEDGNITGLSRNNAYMYRAATLNLDGATLESDNLVGSLSSASIRNIILPRGLDKDVVKESNFSGLTSTDFNGAISLNAGRTQVVGYIKKPGSLRNIMEQVPSFRPNVYNYMQGITLPSVTLSGKLIASDIATGAVNLDANGNYHASQNSGIPTAFENVNTLRNLDISNAIFVDAADGTTIKEENMTLSQLGWGGIVSLKMPTNENMKKVPANFLENCQHIPYLCIPYNYEEIGNAAFYLAGTYWITTTDSQGAEIDNGIYTYTFSKNMEKIGSDPGTDSNDYPNVPEKPVFGAVTSGQVSDVYILRNGYEDLAAGKTGAEFSPTKCWRGGFTSGMTYGWGGFDGGNIYCREKYKNGSFLFTILHYPDQASLPSSYNSDAQYQAMEEAYTDITKQYTKKDQTGAVDANGETIPWPTFSELGRAYNQAIRRLVWADWSPIYATEEGVGYQPFNGDIAGGTINFDPASLPVGVTNAVSQTRFDLEYVGWHEFVLSKATYVAPDETVVNEKIVRDYELDDNWYTFCIPFNMTEEEVINLLGVPASTPDESTDRIQYENKLDGVKQTESVIPEIRTICGVERNSNNNSVTITTSESLSSSTTKSGSTHPKTYYIPSSQHYEENIDAGYSSDVYLRAGYPYLIKPYKLKGTTIAGNNLGKQVITRYDFSLDASAVNYDVTRDQITDITAFARPYEGHKIKAVDQNGDALTHTDTNHSGQDYNYTFLGQFWKQPLPEYCFYQSKHKWYHYTTPKENWYWNPYICIIMVTDESTLTNAKGGKYRKEGECTYPNKLAVDSKGGEVFDKNLQLVYNNGLNDIFGASAREYSFVFDDDIMDFGDGSETTAIDRLNGMDIIPANSKVYNMNGQLVGKSVKGLAKGMYIVNGRKVVIK